MTIKKCLFLLILQIFVCESFAQNNSNPLYWKNHKPYEGYWQQDVQYNIKANIDEKTDILSGEEVLTYTNNSPDELKFVFFHLYENAYQPGSYYDKLAIALQLPDKYGHYEKIKCGLKVDKISCENIDLKTELDNTILKVFLNTPLKSGQSVTFNITFKTYFDIGADWRRMSVFNAYGFKHYNGGHWYPRISVYDSKFGWTTDQHLGHEFYGDYGTYDVELTFANNFIVDATGVLQNENEVLPPVLKSKLDIKNFKDKPLGSAPSIIVPYDSTVHKTWKFHADNVHDFAFLADPTFRIGEAEWNGIKIVALAEEPNAAGWQNAAAYTAKVIQSYSEKVGRYVYPKMIVSDAHSGMEYPMLTMDSGLDPDYKFVLAHEVGHNWFFGIIGNNETYRAAMDEGFTQFITTVFIDSIAKTEPTKALPKSNYAKHFSRETSYKEDLAFYQYLSNAVSDDDDPLNTHSDQFSQSFQKGSGYRVVYNKTATMLYNLEYVLGDELFRKAMQHYFKQWELCHPYFEDFRNSIIAFTHVDLNWFFDEWLETTKKIDYGIKSVRKGKENDTYHVTFKRKGQMQMPIDFQVISQRDSIYNFYIPNTWFTKETKATILPKWIGWDKLNQTYIANIKVQGGISKVIIDPSHRLADVNMLNNSTGVNSGFTFDSKVYNHPDWTRYEFRARPDLWWNGYDGLKMGVNISGGYMNYKHVFDATIWANTGMLQNSFGENVDINKFENISYRIVYSTGLDKFSKNAKLILSAINLDGMNAYKFTYEKLSHNRNNKLFFTIKSMFRNDSADLNYLLYPTEWGISADSGSIRYNNTLSFGIEHSFENPLEDGGTIGFNVRSSFLNSNYDFTTISFTIKDIEPIGKLKLKSRFFAQYAMGNSMPVESSLYLAGANPEEMMDNKYVRSIGFVPKNWQGYGITTNNFQYGGGLNLRGYAGYLVAQKDTAGNTLEVYRGTSGAAINAELEFDKLFKFHPKQISNIFSLNTYLFGDIGIINYNILSKGLLLADYRADAGVGLALTVKKWGPLQIVKPLTIRFDMPLFLNRIPAVETKYLKFRWIVSVCRAF